MKKRKVLVIGLDGMDPALVRRFTDSGRMPHFKRLLDLGAARPDLSMHGALPTITPAQWTTLACGCLPNVHGITDFWNQDPDSPDTIIYGLDSRLCKAEPIWNVTAEAGLRTLVWHWPGSSWPPTSLSDNLYVVDGAQPASVNYSIANVDLEKLIVADRDAACDQLESGGEIKNLGDAADSCVIDRLYLDDDAKYETYKVGKDRRDWLLNRYRMKRIKNVNFHDVKRAGGNLSSVPFDRLTVRIRKAEGWQVPVPGTAFEFSIWTGRGEIRYPALILMNDAGIYDHVAVYRSKADPEPLFILYENDLAKDVIGEIRLSGRLVRASRWYKLLEIRPDGSQVRLWMSTAFRCGCDERWHPKELLPLVTGRCGEVPPFSQMGGTSLEFAQKILTPVWRENALWQSAAIRCLIKEKELDAVFSHHHFIDHSAHQFWNYALQKPGREPEEAYQEQIARTYEAADAYIGSFMPLLDEGWTLFVVSDHGEQIHTKDVARIGAAGGVSAGIMRELGWTVMKKDAAGRDTDEVDFSKTRALAVRTSYIRLNLKGRDPEGIVEPEDKRAVEEQIIDDLYSYRDERGERVIACAFRNKEAALIGLDGPDTGDIVYQQAEGHVSEHGYGLSTYGGYFGTSVAPVFAAAGRGILHREDLTRTIRQTDLAPTVSELLGVRMTADCEGAPVYQILTDRQG